MLEDVARTSKTLPKGRARHPLVRADPVARQLSAPHIGGTDLQTRRSRRVRITTLSFFCTNDAEDILTKNRVIHKTVYHIFVIAILHRIANPKANEKASWTR